MQGRSRSVLYRMISFAEYGNSDPNKSPLRLQPQPGRLTQHWVHGGQLLQPALAPLAGLDLRADGVMVFAAAMKPGPLDVFQSKGKEFTAGLWNGNVVELFLLNPDNNRYLEVHLAPTAQWWACVFTAVRVRETEENRPLPLSLVQHHRDKKGRNWQASLQVPAKVICQLLGAAGFMHLRANLTAITRPLTGPPCYFSLAALPGTKPDFHQPDAWLELAR